MLLLLDIGNTHAHAGLAGPRSLRRTCDFETPDLTAGKLLPRLRAWLDGAAVERVVMCSVVPAATPEAHRIARALTGREALQLTPETLRGVGIDYPRPETIGQDRLANALAARHHYGAPVVAIDFGTAVTFDVVDQRGCYVGGIIAPGLAALTDYLHEKTALLPRVKIREPRRFVGRSTEQAMLAGAVHGYRGLVRELIRGLEQELGTRRIPVVATGGYARLIARHLPEIGFVHPHLALEGLRLLAGGEAEASRRASSKGRR